MSTKYNSRLKQIDDWEDSDGLGYMTDDTLAREIQRLTNELKSKDNLIRSLKEKNQSINSERVNQIFLSISDSVDSADDSAVSFIDQYHNSSSPSTKANLLLDYLDKKAASNESTVSRLCQQLKGHVQFLTRLTSTPDLQSLFLISQESGNVFLPETTKRLILEQSARTTELLATFPSYPTFPQGFPTIDTILGKRDQLSTRLDSLKNFLNDEKLTSQELRALLFQDIEIINLLVNLIESSLKTSETSEIIQRNIENEIISEIIDQKPSKRAKYIEKVILSQKSQTLRQELSISLRQEIENDFDLNERPLILEDIREKVTKELLPRLTKEITEKVTDELRPRLTKEITEKVTDELRPRLTKEITEKVTDELRPRLTKEITETVKINFETKEKPKIIESLKRQSLESVREQFELTEKPRIISDLRTRLYPDPSSLSLPTREREREGEGERERVLRKLIGDIRNDRIEKSDSLFVTLKSLIQSKYSTSSTSDTAPVLDTVNRPVLDREVVGEREAFERVCEALVLENQKFSIEYFVSLTLRLSNDIIRVRQKYRILEPHLFNAIENLIVRISHLEQLHTQTRALLVRQSQLISDLRLKSESSSSLSLSQWTASR